MLMVRRSLPMMPTTGGRPLTVIAWPAPAPSTMVPLLLPDSSMRSCPPTNCHVNWPLVLEAPALPLGRGTPPWVATPALQLATVGKVSVGQDLGCWGGGR